MNKQNLIKKILLDLEHLYPDAPLALRFKDGFQLLIAVILSAQCTDERVNQVTDKLFRKYKFPQDFIDVPREDLENAIRPTGFYRNKAKLIQECCVALIEKFKGELPQKIDQMTALPGVGRKTAAMVLGNAFHSNQGIAVDTHVKRVVWRLNISEEKDVNKIEAELMQFVPGDKWTYFSNAMIIFGRNICQSRKPKCAECPFQSWCPSPDKTTLI